MYPRWGIKNDRDREESMDRIDRIERKNRIERIERIDRIECKNRTELGSDDRLSRFCVFSSIMYDESSSEQLKAT